MISQGFKNNETEEIHYTLILTMTPKLVRLWTNKHVHIYL
jgi:hypothetical protein